MAREPVPTTGEMFANVFGMGDHLEVKMDINGRTYIQTPAGNKDISIEVYALLCMTAKLEQAIERFDEHLEHRGDNQ